MRLRFFFFFAVAIFIPAFADAAGFYIQEQSVAGLGSAFAGAAANPHDASILYYNPAGMTQLPGTQGTVAVHIIAPRTNLEDRGTTFGGVPDGGNDGGNPYSPSPVPNLYLSHQTTENFWLGIGVSFPFGLSNEYEEGWFGRFDSTKSELTTTDIQPSMAVKLWDNTAIGAGVNIQFADGHLENAVRDAAEGTQTLDGDAMSFGYTAGFLTRPLPATTVGVSYRSEMNHVLEGHVRVAGTAASDFDVPVSADLRLPDIATFSIAQDVTSKIRLLGSATWFGWNVFDKIEPVLEDGTSLGAVVQNYQTSWAYSGGIEYRPNAEWILRAGYQFDETPVEDQFRNTRTPDGDRQWFATGATYDVDERWSLDMAAVYIDIAEGDINLARNSGLANIKARSGGDAGIFSLGLNYKFQKY